MPEVKENEPAELGEVTEDTEVKRGVIVAEKVDTDLEGVAVLLERVDIKAAMVEKTELNKLEVEVRFNDTVLVIPELRYVLTMTEVGLVLLVRRTGVKLMLMNVLAGRMAVELNVVVERLVVELIMVVEEKDVLVVLRLGVLEVKVLGAGSVTDRGVDMELILIVAAGTNVSVELVLFA